MSTTICRGCVQAFLLENFRKGLKTMNSIVRIININSEKLWNGQDSRSFDLSCLFLGLFLQESISNVIDFIKSYPQTEFVYLFMPWHRHAKE